MTHRTNIFELIPVTDTLGDTERVPVTVTDEDEDEDADADTAADKDKLDDESKTGQSNSEEKDLAPLPLRNRFGFVASCALPFLWFLLFSVCGYFIFGVWYPAIKYEKHRMQIDSIAVDNQTSTAQLKMVLGNDFCWVDACSSDADLQYCIRQNGFSLGRWFWVSSMPHFRSCELDAIYLGGNVWIEKAFVVVSLFWGFFSACWIVQVCRAACKRPQRQ